MMLKVLPLTALVLGLSGGAAFADRHGGEHRGGTVVVREHHDWHGGGERREWHGGGGWNGGGRVVIREPRHERFERRPIYVSRPVIREHYYNYYRRPQLIVENYGAQPGYYWVAGAWNWDGYQWCWQPGHYEPDASYEQYAPGYSDGY